MEKSYVVGIDIGGQTAKIGVVDMRGNVLAQSAIRSDDTTDHEEFITKLCAAVTELVNKNLSMDQIRGIGIGAPNANYYKGTIENTVNLKWGGSNNVFHLPNS